MRGEIENRREYWKIFMIFCYAIVVFSIIIIFSLTYMATDLPLSYFLVMITALCVYLPIFTVLSYQAVNYKTKQLSEKLLIKENALETSINSIGFADLNSNLTYVNPAFLKLWGYDNEEEVLGRSIFEFLKKTRRAEKIMGILMSERSWEGEVTGIKKDGTEFPLLLVSNIVLNNDGKYIGIMGSLVDITELKKAEELMLNAKIAAENASRVKSEFIMNMSHEIRTPLNSVIGFSHVLLEKSGNLNEKQIHYAENIIDNGKRLLDIFNEIMVLSKMEHKEMEIHQDSFSISDVVSEVESSMRSSALEKDIAIYKNIEPENVIIKADEIKFKHILYNLIHNAIKFTPYGGEIMINANKSEEMLYFFVKDTGIGIPQECHDKLFDQFYQVDSSITKPYGGVGLGLTVVKKFVEMQGGEVFVESNPEKGSSFGFSIPVEPRTTL